MSVVSLSSVPHGKPPRILLAQINDGFSSGPAGLTSTAASDGTTAVDRVLRWHQVRAVSVGQSLGLSQSLSLSLSPSPRPPLFSSET